MKKSSLIAFAIFITSFILFSSCSDSDIPKASDELLFREVQDEVYSTTIEEEAFINAEEAVKAFTVSGFAKSGNAGLVVKKKSDSKDFPIDYQIDYGNRYVDKNGNVYKGIINQSVLSKKESEFQFDKFYINDNLVEGSKKVKIIKAGVINSLSDVKITNNKSNQIKYRIVERQRIIVDNNNTVDVLTDDSYIITGSCVGNIFKNGNEFEYNFDIEKPLKYVVGQKNYVSGITIIRIGTSTHYTNYGVGEKDKNATWLFR